MTSVLTVAPSRASDAPHHTDIHSGVVRSLLRWLDAWEDRRHLQALSDLMLRDMGLERDQIDDVIRGLKLRP